MVGSSAQIKTLLALKFCSHKLNHPIPFPLLLPFSGFLISFYVDLNSITSKTKKMGANQVGSWGHNHILWDQNTLLSLKRTCPFHDGGWMVRMFSDIYIKRLHSSVIRLNSWNGYQKLYVIINFLVTAFKLAYLWQKTERKLMQNY